MRNSLLAVVLFARLSGVAWGELSVRAGKWAFVHEPARVLNTRMGVEADGQFLEWSGNESLGEGLRWQAQISQQKDGSLLVAAIIRNTGSRARRLGKVKLLDATLELPGKAVALAMSGWQMPSMVKPVGPRVTSKVVTEVVGQGAAVQLGFLTLDRADTDHAVWRDPAGRLHAQSWCDFAGWELAPGAEVHSETLRVSLDRDPLRGLEQWADRVARQYNVKLWDGTVAGWLGWSWVESFHSERYEDVVRRNAKAIRERLPGLDIKYIWVSLGNLQGKASG